MAITRLDVAADATWARAWSIDTTAEVTAFLATYTDPLGPKRGDVIYDVQVGQLFLVVGNGNAVQVSGIAVLPIDLLNDVINSLPVANGGTGLATLGTNLIPFGAGTSPFGSSGNLAYSSAGGLVLNNLFDISGAAAGQVKFPATQNPSTDANTLDDYEEGTWTPAVTFGGGSTGITYVTATGTYTRIGRQVVVCGIIFMSSKGSSTGNAVLTGLPFTVPNSGSFNSSSAAYFSAMAATIVNISLRTLVNTATILPFIQAAGTAVQMTDADFTNNSIIFMHSTYFTS